MVMRSRPAGLVRLAALALAVSGVLFFAFPVVRPYFETSSDPAVIASGFASARWVAAHTLAMAGFVLLPMGFFGLSELLGESPARQMALWALALTWIGAGLTLPFFGAEAFGLQVIGQQALAHHSTDVLAVADMVRFGGVGIYLIITGLLLVGIGTILGAWAVWRSRIVPRWSSVLLAAGFALYLPQFAGPPVIRVADGLAIAVGAIWTAYGMSKA